MAKYKLSARWVLMGSELFASILLDLFVLRVEFIPLEGIRDTLFVNYRVEFT